MVRRLKVRLKLPLHIEVRRIFMEDDVFLDGSPLIQPYFDPRQLCCYSSHERVKYGGCREDTTKRRRSTSDSEICQYSESVTGPSPQKVRPKASARCRCNCTSNDLGQTLWARYLRQPPGVGKSKCWADLVSATRGQVVPDIILILVCKNTALLG